MYVIQNKHGEYYNCLARKFDGKTLGLRHVYEDMPTVRISTELMPIRLWEESFCVFKLTIIQDDEPVTY